MREYEGVFTKEGQTRFVAWVEIDGRSRKCFVPTSTKVSRFLDPVGRTVKVEKVNDHFQVEAIRCGRSWVLVNSSKANDLFRAHLEAQGRKVAQELTVGGYRFDLYSRKVGYEIKSLITDKRKLVYPNAPSERRERQLERLMDLLRKGQKVEWVFVSLSPMLKCLVLNSEDEFVKMLVEAQALGLKIRAYGLSQGKSLSPLKIERI